MPSRRLIDDIIQVVNQSTVDDFVKYDLSIVKCNPCFFQCLLTFNTPFFTTLVNVDRSFFLG